MNSQPVPRLLVVCRSLGVPSEVWILRQIEAFDAFDTSVVCWKWLRDGANAHVPVHELVADFDEPELSAARWARRLIALPGGNLRATAGAEKRRLIELTRQISPDVVLCHFGNTALRFLPVAETLGIPLVTHFHGLDLSSSLQDRYYRWSLIRCVNRFAHAIVVGSHQQKRLYAMGISPKKISRIPCGAPTAMFLPKADYTCATCRFIAVSRLVPWKGLDFTIRAFARARQQHERMELHIVGAGPMESALRTLASGLNLYSAVVFHGLQSSEDIRNLLASSDVFVQHSLDYESGWQEGFGVSITEASACGLPVIVTNSGGIPDQISHGVNGFITPQRDCEAMADCMVRLAKDQLLRETMGKAGRERAEREFDSGDLAAKLQRLLLIAAGRKNVAGHAELV